MMFGLSEIAVYDQYGTVVSGKCVGVELDGYTSEMSIVVDGYVIDKLYFGEDYDLFKDEEDWYGYLCWYVASDRYERSRGLIS